MIMHWALPNEDEGKIRISELFRRFVGVGVVKPPKVGRRPTASLKKPQCSP